MKWNPQCHRTSGCFFFFSKSVPTPVACFFKFWVRIWMQSKQIINGNKQGLLLISIKLAIGHLLLLFVNPSSSYQKLQNVDYKINCEDLQPRGYQPIHVTVESVRQFPFVTSFCTLYCPLVRGICRPVRSPLKLLTASGLQCLFQTQGLFTSRVWMLYRLSL